MNDSLKKVAAAAAGIVGVEVTPVVASTIADNPSTDAGIIQLIVQVVIGIVTLIQLFKKKKDASSK